MEPHTLKSVSFFNYFFTYTLVAMASCLFIYFSYLLLPSGLDGLMVNSLKYQASCYRFESSVYEFSSHQNIITKALEAGQWHKDEGNIL